MASLSEYLKQRGLKLDPLPIGETRKLSDDTLSTITNIEEDALIALLQPRIDMITDELVKNAIPEEVVVLRQAIVEIGGLVDDHRAYKKELERRKKGQDDAKPEEEKEAQPSPPVVEGEEGSL